MIIPVDKEKVLQEFNEKYVKEMFNEEYSNIYEKFNNNKESIKKELINNFDNVCKIADSLQNKSLKGKIQYIYISYLRTNLMQNSGIYRIDMYDDKWFLDKEECRGNLDLSFIYEPLFKHSNELLEKRKEYGRTITEMDIEKIKVSEGNKYNGIAIDILESIVCDFLNCESYKEMKKSEEIMIFVGEYRDEVKIIYENSPSKED
ncbi:hypothetical protein FDC50_16310 [Clostridium botulinum]|nr:hypothetical protein KU41_12635 [Clostridium botulinum]MBY6802527.1 hypothetical protein [Clostridium botulinum]MBY6812664.1 hypothetical protein [Clostridium botulinum]MBY6819228.1 hypothetical protein [Clostridium botulinum]NFJ50642.1 hypothetical protein [Clostridium botulinum]